MPQTRVRLALQHGRSATTSTATRMIWAHRSAIAPHAGSREATTSDRMPIIRQFLETVTERLTDYSTLFARCTMTVVITCARHGCDQSLQHGCCLRPVLMGNTVGQHCFALSFFPFSWTTLLDNTVFCALVFFLRVRFGHLYLQKCGPAVWICANHSLGKSTAQPDLLHRFVNGIRMMVVRHSRLYSTVFNVYRVSVLSILLWIQSRASWF